MPGERSKKGDQNERAKDPRACQRNDLGGKAGLTSGRDAWFTKAIERLNIPSIHLSDGPHGLRTIIEDDQNLLSGKSIPAVCFPAECGMAASFDRELLYETGVELAKEAQAIVSKPSFFS